jgi:hypothetical protein
MRLPRTWAIYQLGAIHVPTDAKLRAARDTLGMEIHEWPREFWWRTIMQW